MLRVELNYMEGMFNSLKFFWYATVSVMHGILHCLKKSCALLLVIISLSNWSVELFVWNRYSECWVCKAVKKTDSVWVSTNFHVQTFIKSGVGPFNVVKVVQFVNVIFFNLNILKPFVLLQMSVCSILSFHKKSISYLEMILFSWAFSTTFSKGPTLYSISRMKIWVNYLEHFQLLSVKHQLYM
jgi:hypothetical protein